MADDVPAIPPPVPRDEVQMVLTYCRATSAFTIQSSVPSTVEQLGILEFALMEVKRRHALASARANGPRVVPGVFPMGRG